MSASAKNQTYWRTVASIAEDCQEGGYDVAESVAGSEWTFKPRLARVVVYGDDPGDSAHADTEVCQKAFDQMYSDVLEEMNA